MDIGRKLIERILKTRSSLTRHKKKVTVMAALVVFVTTYALILPAITLDENKADETPGIDPGTKVETNVDAESGSDAGKSGGGPDDQISEKPGSAGSPADEAGESAGETKSSGSSKSDTNGGASGKDDPKADPEGEVKDSNADKDIKLIEEKTELTFDGDGYKVIAEVGADAKLPADTKLKVREVRKDTKDENGEKYDYEGYCKKALKAVRDEDGKEAKNQTRKVKLFDISFESGSASDQNADNSSVLINDDGTVEPAAKVKVRIVFDKAVDTKDKGKTRAVHFDEKYEEQTGKLKADVLKTKAEGSKKEKMKETSFQSDQFSVYGIVYTVDFEYEKDGQKYAFTIPGGGYISLSDVLSKVKAEKEVSDVENVRFSDPELLWAGKVSEDTTVGEIKEANGLECKYSSDVTKKQIEKTDATQVEAGDWALISLRPFSSEETLTVSMDDGEQIVIKVTDDAVAGIAEIDTNKEYVLYTEIEETIYVLKTDGSTVTASRSDLDGMDNNYKWKFSYVYTDLGTGIPYYIIRPCDDNTKSIALNWSSTAPWDYVNSNPLVQSGSNNISLAASGKGFKFEGYNNTRLVVEDGWFAGRQNGNYSNIVIYEQGQLNKYNFTVTSDDYAMGSVSGKNVLGNGTGNVAEFDSRTKDNKKNNGKIVATPQSTKYLFDYWDLNGTRLNYGATIPDNDLTIPYQGSTLTAHFKRNPNWQPSEDEKEGRIIDKTSLQEWLDGFKGKQIPLDQDSCDKTAEVYDYENRIYRVDLKAKSNMETFDGIVDLGFMLDVSGSMKFPSRLKKIDSLSDVDVWKLNQKGYWNYGQWVETGNQNDSSYWNTIGLETDKTYYLIAEKSTRATVFRIFYDNGIWKRVDASYENTDPKNVKVIGNNDASFGKDPQGTHYPFYKDDDEPNLRLNYEQNSLSNTIDELNSILNTISVAKNSNDDPNVKVAWNTFCANVNDSDHTFKSVKNKDDITIRYAYSGGTRTDLSLNDANSFGWENSATKYAILITDGAPQYGGSDHPSDLNGDLTLETERLVAATKQKAEALKEQGVTLITVGLSMKDVKVGSVLLYDIASKDENGDPYFYSAESGDELEYILYEIIQNIVKKADVQGNVTDTINEAFYPVDKNTGRPLENGTKIDLEGNITTDTSKPYGTIIKSGDTYKVDWTEQLFKYDEGWHGTVYVKAKEDLLGGNAVKTNSGEAEVQANKYKLEGSNSYVEFNNETKAKGHKTFESPRVNVNELSFLHDETEWTVYLGTNVDPKDQIKKLYNNILVEEVIKKNKGADTNGDGLPDKVVYQNGDTDNNWYPLTESIADDRESEAGADSTRNSFNLNELLNSLAKGKNYDWWDYTKNEPNWDVFIDQASTGNGITIPYKAYGLDDDSNINIKLSKEIMSGEESDLIGHSPHATTVVGDGVEKYTLTVLYTPDYSVLPTGQGGNGSLDYHVGTNGTAYQGHAAGTETSRNKHIINVFAKSLRITKTNENFNTNLNGAEFKLYLASRQCETAAEVKANIVPGTQPEELTVSEGYFFTKDKLTAPGDGQYYYIVEEKAPVGYTLMTTPISVELAITDSYNSNILEEDEENHETDISAQDLKNWTQTANLTISDASAGQQLVDANGNAISPIAADSNTGTVYYKVANNPGVELPSAGGPGTTWMYILGLILTVGAGMVFAVRRRMRCAKL